MPMMMWLQNRRSSAQNQNAHTLDYVMVTKLHRTVTAELHERLSNPRFPNGTSMKGDRWLR